jgi:hypothetical protein
MEDFGRNCKKSIDLLSEFSQKGVGFPSWPPLRLRLIVPLSSISFVERSIGGWGVRFRRRLLRLTRWW